MNQIIIKGAKTRNLKNVDLTLAKHKIHAFTGVSGSGKSSLVFHTIAAEAQRKMNETYPSYVRNRLPHSEPPAADYIKNLSPAIIMNQKSLGDNRRSTVGTAADINPALRLLFSRFGKPFVGYSDIFSFNNPNGMCPDCEGLGTQIDINISDLLDYQLSLNEGGIRFSPFKPGSYLWKRYTDSGFFDNNKKIADFDSTELQMLLYASACKPTHPRKEWYKSALYEGLIPRIIRSFTKNSSEAAKRHQAEMQRFSRTVTCTRCDGYRLNQRALSCKLNNYHIGECLSMEIHELKDFLSHLSGDEVQQVAKRITIQLTHLCSVGLDYLSLDRETSSLSGGESQRIKLIRALGSSLADLLYIFDEPSIGLHPYDMQAIGKLIQEINQQHNTVLLIDHDPQMIQLADEVHELGPAAGKAGGQLVYTGSFIDWQQKQMERPPLMRQQKKLTQFKKIEEIHKNNVHIDQVDLPINGLVAITGVAGSGKSSFVKALYEKDPANISYLNQKMIRGSSRSSIASYLTIFDPIRQLFSKTNQVPASLFSSNGQGKCPVCKGKGYLETELAFLDKIRNPCEACQGTKYQKQVLEYCYSGKNIVEILTASIDESCTFFKNIEAIYKPLSWLRRIGLGYLTLGQTLDTLSGGELQRLKLASRLDKHKKTIILDEPTTGLSQSDVQQLLHVLTELIDKKNSLIVVEHNIEFIRMADWMIEFGPSSGKKGGQIIFAGEPNSSCANPKSITGSYLRKLK